MSNEVETPDSDTASFIGGMKVPLYGGGSAAASVPLVELTISVESLRWRVRGWAGSLIKAVAGAKEFMVDINEVAEAFRLRGQWMRVGVGFALKDGSEYNFYTWRNREKILHKVGELGITLGPPRTALTLRNRRGGTD